MLVRLLIGPNEKVNPKNSINRKSNKTVAYLVKVNPEGSSNST